MAQLEAAETDLGTLQSARQSGMELGAALDKVTRSSPEAVETGQPVQESTPLEEDKPEGMAKEGQNLPFCLGKGSAKALV